MWDAGEEVRVPWDKGMSWSLMWLERTRVMDYISVSLLVLVFSCTSQLPLHSDRAATQGFAKVFSEKGTLKCSGLHFIQASLLSPYTSYPTMGIRLLYSEHWSHVRTVLPSISSFMSGKNSNSNFLGPTPARHHSHIQANWESQRDSPPTLPPPAPLWTGKSVHCWS